MRELYKAFKFSFKQRLRELDEEHEPQVDRKISQKICRELRILIESTLADLTDPIRNEEQDWYRKFEGTVTLRGGRKQQKLRKVTIRSSSIFPQQAERIDIHVEGSERFLRLGKEEGKSLDKWEQPRRVLFKEASFFNSMATAAIMSALGKKHSG